MGSVHEDGDASAKLRAYLAESAVENSLAMSIIQRTHWNLACAHIAQQALYAQQFQACLQQERCVGELSLASPAASLEVSTFQNQFIAHAVDNSGRTNMPMRPPGVWDNRERASSCSSLASTRASSEEEYASQLSEKLRIEAPTRDPFCGGGTRVYWSVDAKKFSSCDMQVVSPAFALAPSVEFKLLIKSAAQGGKRGQAGFKASLGKGSIELKCICGPDAHLPKLTFRLSLVANSGKQQKRSPVSHDFNEETVYFPSAQIPWDFKAAIAQSQEVVVCLEVAPVQL